MNCNSQFKENLYLKTIEYKRSIGITQWSVLSLFVTASSAILVFGLNQENELMGLITRLFGLLVLSLGILLYGRYRSINQSVSDYLVDLESEIGCNFQERLNQTVHSEYWSTNRILNAVLVIYGTLSILVYFL